MAAIPQRALHVPLAKREEVVEIVHGETLRDPYRWMEDESDPDLMPWLRAQDAHARGLLRGLPVRSRLLRRIRELSAETVVTADVQRAGGRLFFEQRPVGADNYQLFVMEGGAPRLLVDPVRLSSQGHCAIDWWIASPTGEHVVYGLSRDGSEDSTLHVVRAADGTVLPEAIPDTQHAMPSWLDDGSGFFYNQLTGAPDTPERFLDSQARFHRLGTPATADPVLVRRDLDPGLAFERIQSPLVLTWPGARHAVLALTDVRHECRWLIAPIEDVLAGRARWQDVAGFEDEVTALDLHGEELVLLAHRGHPRGRLLRTTVHSPAVETATELVPQDTAVLEDLARARDGLYLRYLDGGISRLRRLGVDGVVREVPLPIEGSICELFATPEEDGVLVSLTSWFVPVSVWSIDAAGRARDIGLNPPPDIDLTPYESRRFHATAADGTRIPVTVLHRRGLRLDGRAPCCVSAYGSYGIAAYTPAFAGRALALLDAGAVLAYAGVRGGGEHGREWHEAGRLERKPNTWRDLIAVCEDLCARHYTSPAHLAIAGRSAGGIAAGRAMTERPDLFAAVISAVGWSNPLRYEVEPNGYGEEPEWGSIADPAGFRALKAIDSYQAVQDGVAYPAVLLTTGLTDSRVAPFHAAKMAARLQAASSSGKPVLLRVDFDSGHGMGTTRAQQDDEAADTFAFILWQCA